MADTSGAGLAAVITGVVTSFEEDRGYGFVAEGGGRELYARPADVVCHLPRPLAVGQRVRFEVHQGPAGPQVVAVRRF